MHSRGSRGGRYATAPEDLNFQFSYVSAKLYINCILIATYLLVFSIAKIAPVSQNSGGLAPPPSPPLGAMPLDPAGSCAPKTPLLGDCGDCRDCGDCGSLLATLASWPSPIKIPGYGPVRERGCDDDNNAVGIYLVGGMSFRFRTKSLFVFLNIFFLPCASFSPWGKALSRVTW